MTCKVNNDLLQESLNFLNEVEFLDDFDILYECQYAMAHGCQMHSMGSCDKGQSCFDI